MVTDTKHGRIISYTPITKKVEEMLDQLFIKYLELDVLNKQLSEVLPFDHYAQFMGKGDCVIIKEYEERESND